MPKISETAIVTMVLSPRMPLALQEWRRMKTSAERAGFQVESMRDPRVPISEWRDAVQSMDDEELMELSAIDEQQAAALGALNHSPATLVNRCGRVHSWPILGVMPNSAWIELLKSRESQLRQLPCC